MRTNLWFCHLLAIVCLAAMHPALSAGEKQASRPTRSGQTPVPVTDAEDDGQKAATPDLAESEGNAAGLDTRESDGIDQAIADAWRHARDLPPPTHADIEQYRQRLELRLLERYNNLPDHAGQVAKVSVVLSKPLEPSLDGSRIRAEFDQLVYDPWGKRIPALEREYYVVIFGSGGVREVRSDPSIRVGLDLEKVYSEHAPPAPDPSRNLPDDAAFRPAPKAKMPTWWRPEFNE